VETKTVCDMAPPSDQLVKLYCVPPEPWGEVVAMVCVVPVAQLTITGLAVAVPPSSETASPGGTVAIVTDTGVDMLRHQPPAMLPPPAPLLPVCANNSQVPLGLLVLNSEAKVAAPSVAA